MSLVVISWLGSDELLSRYQHPLRHVRQYWYCSGPVVTLLPATPSLINRILRRTSRTTEDGLSSGLNFHLIQGLASFSGSVLTSISLMLESDFEILAALAKMSSMMIGPRRWLTDRLSFGLLEKPLWPLVADSLLECFVATVVSLLQLLLAFLV